MGTWLSIVLPTVLLHMFSVMKSWKIIAHNGQSYRHLILGNLTTFLKTDHPKFHSNCTSCLLLSSASRSLFSMKCWQKVWIYFQGGSSKEFSLIKPNVEESISYPPAFLRERSLLGQETYMLRCQKKVRF